MKRLVLCALCVIVGSTASTAAPVYAAEETPAAAPVLAAGSDETGLAFRDERPLEVSWDASATARLCNLGQRTARKLEVTLTGFGFRRGGGTVEDGDVIALPQPPKQLDAGACANLTVKRVKGVEAIDSGSYDGILAVTARGADIARRAVRLSGPSKTPPAAVAAAGAADTAHLEANRRWIFEEAQLEHQTLALKAPSDDETLPGAGCKKPKEGEGWDDDACPYIGSLFDGSHSVEVFIGGPPDTSSRTGLALIPLRMEGDRGRVGKYEGSLDPGQTDETDDAVKAEVVIKDSEGFAIAALILGALLALLQQFLTTTFRLRWNLRGRRQELKSKYGKAKLPTGFQRPSDADITAYADTVKEATKAYQCHTIMFDASGGAYKKIETSMKLAEDDARCLSDGDFKTAAASLHAKIGAVVKFLREQYHLDTAPKLAAVAASLVKPRALKVGEAKTTVAQAGEQEKLLTTWLDLAQRMKQYDAWFLDLVRRAGSMSDDDQVRLIETNAKLNEVRHELMEADDEQALERLHTARDVDTVYARLAALGSRYEVWPTGVASKPDFKDLPAGGNKFFRLERLLTGPTTRFAAPAELLGLAKQAASTAAESVTITKTLGFLGDLVAYLIPILAAIFTGLTAFYTGDAWGTWEDYVKVILVGTVAGALAKALLDLLTRLFTTPAPDAAVEADPKAATVEPKKELEAAAPTNA